MKIRNVTGWWVLLIALIFSANAFASDIKNSRLMPEGKVIVSRNGQAVAEYSKEMPVPAGAMLTCKGRCGVKLDDMLLVAEDQSRFSIDMKNNQRVLNVVEGTVYFGLSTIPRTIVFLTPDGAVSADRVLIHASANTKMLEGYVKAAAGASELGVLSGGTLPLMTNQGVKALKSGDRFIFAQSDMGEGDDKGGGALLEGSGGLSDGQIAAIVAGSVVGGGVVFTIIENADDDDDDGSPSTP